MASRMTSRDMIERLISFDTVSRESNLGLIHFVRDYLAALGVEARLTHDEEGRKANLYATLGPDDRSGVMLSGHTDVVPVDGQDWESDPWTVCERDGRLYGRGTADMKSFIAIALAMALEFLERGLETPIHFAFSFDEEVGCLGVRRLIADRASVPVRPRVCIVGEPTEMKVVAAHKGKHSYVGHVSGHECHSSMVHQGANAVEAAAELVAHLKQLARRKRDEGPFDDGYDPPYTSVHTGTIHGGTALNIVPKDCTFEFEWRYLPDDDPDALFGELSGLADRLREEMRAVAPAADIRFVLRSDIPGLNADPSGEAVALAQALSGGNTVGKVSFGTEAGLFQQADIPTVICGPGSILQAHKPDEFIALEQIALCEAFMLRLMDRVCQPAA